MSQKTGYEALLEELEQMNKSMTVDDEQDDEKVKAAYEEGQSEEYDDEKDDDEKDDDEKDDDEVLGKSFTARIGDKEVEAYDGTALVKSLMADLDRTRTESKVEREAREKSDQVLQKALGQFTALLKSQHEQIESLRKSLDAIGNTGRGRRTLVNLHERQGPSGNETNSEGVTPKELMTKALSAMTAGRMTANEVATVETYINRGLAVPENLLGKIAS